MFTEAGAFEAKNTTQQITHLIFVKAPVSLSLQLVRWDSQQISICRH